MVKGYKRDFTKFFGLTVENIQKIFYIVITVSDFRVKRSKVDDKIKV